jgi:hypothetical protein
MTDRSIQKKLQEQSNIKVYRNTKVQHQEQHHKKPSKYTNLQRTTVTVIALLIG